MSARRRIFSARLLEKFTWNSGQIRSARALLSRNAADCPLSPASIRNVMRHLRRILGLIYARMSAPAGHAHARRALRFFVDAFHGRVGDPWQPRHARHHTNARSMPRIFPKPPGGTLADEAKPDGISGMTRGAAW